MAPRPPGQVRLGGTRAQAPSPLPQEYPPEVRGGGAPVQLANGFTAWLPGRTRIFFQRFYFLDYPRPLQMAAFPPFPIDLTIFKLQAPAQQVIVFDDVRFNVYIHSGIGQDDLDLLPPGRAVTFLGFQFSNGNRGITDYNTNIQARGTPVIANANFGTPVAPQAGGGSIWPLAGSIVPQLDNYAGYIMPNTEFTAKVSILRAPNFDVRLFSALVSGWVINETEFNKMIDMLKG